MFFMYLCLHMNGVRAEDNEQEDGTSRMLKGVHAGFFSTKIFFEKPEAIFFVIGSHVYTVTFFRAKTNFGPVARIIRTRVQRMTNPAGKWSIQPMYHG